MKTYYNIVTGRNLDIAPSLPVSEISDRGKAIGQTPGWLALLDPDIPAVTGLGFRNIVEPSPSVFSSNVDVSGTLDTFPNGETAILKDTTTDHRLLSNVSLNSESFTIFMVMSWLPVGSPSTFTQVTRAATLNTDLSPSIVIRTGNDIALFNANSTENRLNITNPFGSGEPVFIMFTGSKQQGLRGFVNGVEVSSDPTDKRGFDGQFSAGEWSFAYNKADAGSVLKYGAVGFLSADMGLTENAKYRESLETWFMSQYGI